jgi:hypothetical protein
VCLLGTNSKTGFQCASPSSAATEYGLLQELSDWATSRIESQILVSEWPSLVPPNQAERSLSLTRRRVLACTSGFRGFDKTEYEVSGLGEDIVVIGVSAVLLKEGKDERK